MAEEASVALMLWDGKSHGTLMNGERLVRLGKSLVIYVAGREEFVEIRTRDEWQAFLASCSEEVVHGLEDRLKKEDSAMRKPESSLFDEGDTRREEGHSPNPCPRTHMSPRQPPYAS